MSNSTVVAEEYRKKYEVYIGQLREENRKLKETINKMEVQVVTGQAFEQMMKATHENEVVKGSWDRFMMTLRMAGYDGSTK